MQNTHAISQKPHKIGILTFPPYQYQKDSKQYVIDTIFLETFGLSS